jgi:hypothetical protein
MTEKGPPVVELTIRRKGSERDKKTSTAAIYTANGAFKSRRRRKSASFLSKRLFFV